MALLEVNNLTSRYDNQMENVFSDIMFNDASVHDVNVNFTINQGDRLNLKGKNGAGKSSIIKLIMKQNIAY